jgi:hypothetical protein
MDYTRAKLLINSYYPDQVDNNPKLPLYIQCLDEDGFAPLAGYRSTSLQWLNLAKQNTRYVQDQNNLTSREGLAPPKYEDFVGPGYKDKNGLELLARKLVSEAESVVKELDMFMAMSPGEEGSNLDELRGEKANPDVSAVLAVADASHAPTPSNRRIPRYIALHRSRRPDLCLRTLDGRPYPPTSMDDRHS